jgi:hypothetical protein
VTYRSQASGRLNTDRPVRCVVFGSTGYRGGRLVSGLVRAGLSQDTENEPALGTRYRATGSGERRGSPTACQKSSS